MFFWLALFSFSAVAVDCKKLFNKQASFSSAYQNLETSKNNPLALIIGAGSFGLSFAQVISSNFKEVLVYARNPETVKKIKNFRSNERLPQIKLSSNINAASKLDPLINRNLDMLVLALPFSQTSVFIDQHISSLIQIIQNNKDLALLSLSKGFKTLNSNDIYFVEDLLRSKLKPYFKKENFYVLSGPSFALEMAQGQKTLVNLAGYQSKNLKKIKKLISTDSFNVLLSKDIKGVAFGGAVKNITALLAGIAKGLDLSQNTRTALIVQATNELIGIGQDLKASHNTYLGPAYLGDLILSLSPDSRNFNLGLSIGQNLSAENLLHQPDINIEGINTIKEIYKYVENRKNYDLIKTLYQILYENKTPRSILNTI